MGVVPLNVENEREAAKGFRRLKACKHLPALRAALAAHQLKHAMNSKIEVQALAA